MRAMYLIIAVAMLFMFVFVANEVDLGVGGTLLSACFIGVFIYCLFEFAMDTRESRRKPDEQTEFKARLHKMTEANKENRRRTARRRSKREDRG